MKACLHCTGQNPENAQICEYCGQPFQVVEKKRKGSRVYILWILVAIGLFFWILTLTPNNNKPSLTTSESAWYACRQFIEDRLKAPTTAKFEHYNAAKVLVYANAEWRVFMVVDAENSFGAMIRSDFFCQLREEGENWRLLRIEEE